MIQVKVNNSEISIPAQQLNTVNELVEYVKSTIDPETIIISMSKNDSPLTELDWRNPISIQENITLNFTTGPKADFVNERLKIAAEVASSLIEKLESCANSFKQMRIHTANKDFVTFVEDLDAFVSWLSSVFTLEHEMFETEIEKYHTIVNDLELTCNVLQDQQISSSWWAIGDTLLNHVSPILNEIKKLVETSQTKFIS